MKRILQLVVAALLLLTSNIRANELLSNAGFEETTNGLFGTEFTYWTFVIGGATTETTDKVEGNQAFKTAELNTPITYLQQEVMVAASGLKAGDYCELRIRYKVLNSQGGNDLKLDCFWESNTDGRMRHDSTVLCEPFFTSSVWKEKIIDTSVPEGATRFHFRVGVAKDVVVLFDDFSFKKFWSAPEQGGTPSLDITPAVGTIPSKTTDINTPVVLQTLTVTQANLTSPVTFEITGSDKEHFTVTPSSSTSATQTVTVSYAPKATGKHKATLLIDCVNHPTLSQTIKLSGVSYDPANPPVITLTPNTLPQFVANVGTQVRDTLQLTSANCIDYVYASATHIEGNAFSINSTMYSPNIPCKVVITYAPKSKGTHSTQFRFRSEKAQDVLLTVTGTTEGDAPSLTIDYDTVFNWNMANPRALLYEQFNSVEHNTKLALEDWQNVVLSGSRPWWGFFEKDKNGNVVDRYAKATAYGYQTESTGTWEMWMVTPPLDFVNAASKLFTMRVMGDFMFEGHTTALEVYYVDTIVGEDLHMQKLDLPVPVSNDLNGEWSELHLDLTGQNIADVFFMAFRFVGGSGSENSTVYYVDDVSWGRTDLPTISTDSTTIVMRAPLLESIFSGEVTVSTANLQEPVKLVLGGPNKSKFDLSTKELPTTGGTFKLKFETDQEGVHEAYVKLSSRGAADKYIAISILAKGRSGLEQTLADDVMVWGYNNTISIQAEKEHSIGVYDLTGLCLWEGSAASRNIAIPNSGVYLVKIDNQTLKITLP